MKKPLVGDFVPLDEAWTRIFPQHYKQLVTTTQQLECCIRFSGYFCASCHLLEHEDAGMMEVVSVIENTDSSWIVPAEAFPSTKGFGSPRG